MMCQVEMRKCMEVNFFISERLMLDLQNEVYFWPFLVPVRIFNGLFCKVDRCILRMFPVS